MQRHSSTSLHTALCLPPKVCFPFTTLQFIPFTYFTQTKLPFASDNHFCSHYLRSFVLSICFISLSSTNKWNLLICHLTYHIAKYPHDPSCSNKWQEFIFFNVNTWVILHYVVCHIFIQLVCNWVLRLYMLVIVNSAAVNKGECLSELVFLYDDCFLKQLNFRPTY